ncbi:FAD/FMN-dependent dehydrogenase [Chthonomonas calidirosea]|uniref:FAD/FMN-containing dehydrogenases n=1 Tax=Chthonomonas calidirosea (strain DSM 23976 / ICMP 18418 / T49) TaxID=1303518 RepID=S0ESY8_CHTCT|nr:FAD-binding oxidoreductase [Chthonomonas calidirosea]CCW34135.1 FAD/FMN-containing dehydrogenases [Chthonomonas calidirosea T49]CEK15660.1 FAD/FMN-dependent dehydrogenase [Chthonomonas calidirosea]
MTVEGLLALLRDIVGDDGVLSADDFPWPRWWQSPPLAALCPKEKSQLAPLICALEEADVGIVPVGGGTRLHTGYSPSKPVVLVSSVHLNSLLDYQPDDLTVTVEPGMTLADLQGILAKRHQRLALDVPLPDRATLGGIVASAQSGFWRTAYGTPRDILIGVRAMMSGGVEVRGGGKVVKNVAGYDISKLFTGSWGTLGFLTELTFKVHTAPAFQRTLVWEVADLATGARIAFELYQAQLAAVGYWVTNEVASRPQVVLFLQGTRRRVDWQTDAYTDLARKLGVSMAPEELSQERQQEWQNRLARLSDATPLAVRISCLPTEVASLLERIGDAPDLQVTADCACGIVEIAAAAPELLSPKRVRELLPSPRTRLIWTRLDPITPELEDTERWGHLGADFPLQKLLKQSLDPHNTFSPGRFIGHL